MEPTNQVKNMSKIKWLILKILSHTLKVHCMLIKNRAGTMMIQHIHQELLHLKVSRNGRTRADIEGLLPFPGKFEVIKCRIDDYFTKFLCYVQVPILTSSETFPLISYNL